MKTIKQLEEEIKVDIEDGYNVEKYGHSNSDIPQQCSERMTQLLILKDVLKLIEKEFEKQRKTTWDDFEEHSNNPIHQSDFIAWKEELKQKLTGNNESGEKK